MLHIAHSFPYVTCCSLCIARGLEDKPHMPGAVFRSPSVIHFGGAALPPLNFLSLRLSDTVNLSPGRRKRTGRVGTNLHSDKMITFINYLMLVFLSIALLFASQSRIARLLFPVFLCGGGKKGSIITIFGHNR